MRERLVLASTEACHAGLRTEVSLLKEQARPYECGSAWISAVLVPCDAACLAEHPLDSGTEDLGDSGTEDRGGFADRGPGGFRNRGPGGFILLETCDGMRYTSRVAAPRGDPRHHSDPVPRRRIRALPARVNKTTHTSTLPGGCPNLDHPKG